jgi:hypothetical protein
MEVEIVAWSDTPAWWIMVLGGGSNLIFSICIYEQSGARIIRAQIFLTCHARSRVSAMKMGGGWRKEAPNLGHVFLCNSKLCVCWRGGWGSEKCCLPAPHGELLHFLTGSWGEKQPDFLGHTWGRVAVLLLFSEASGEVAGCGSNTTDSAIFANVQKIFSNTCFFSCYSP